MTSSLFSVSLTMTGSMDTPNSSRTEREEMRSISCWAGGGGGEPRRPRQILGGEGRAGEGRGGEGGGTQHGHSHGPFTVLLMEGGRKKEIEGAPPHLAKSMSPSRGPEAELKYSLAAFTTSWVDVSYERRWPKAWKEKGKQSSRHLSGDITSLHKT